MGGRSDGEGTLVSSVLRKVVPASNGLVVEGEFAVVGSGSWDLEGVAVLITIRF